MVYLLFDVLFAVYMLEKQCVGFDLLSKVEVCNGAKFVKLC